ncbi:MAG: CBS domain-containing protein [Anaerolineae bacterium]
MKVRTVLATKGTNVITIGPKQSVMEAVKTLASHRIGAVVVVDAAGVPVGIVSERDVVRRAAVDEHVLTRRVEEIMTKELVTGVPQDDLHSVAHIMTERRFRHLPIVEGSELVGIVSIGDVLKAERDRYRGEIDTLETQLMAEYA